MKKRLWLAAALLLLAALSVPYFSAASARQSLVEALESALSRKVRIQGETRFRILPTPAILADDVTIAEDPAFSLEPFAYVTTIEVQPSFRALLAGRLEPSRIRLTEPSVNLMRASHGWNIQSLVAGKLRTPELEVRNGRLNFKQADFKSPFYLANALIDISVTSTGDIKVFASAEPARTDRGPQGFGVFSLRGSAHLPSGGEPQLDFDVELQPSSLHAFNFFFGARGVNFAGKLSAKGHLHGPWSASTLTSTLQFEGLEPQGFLPFSGKSNRLELKGILDVPGQRFALDSTGGDQLRVSMRARDLFQSPRGALLLDLRGVAAAKLLDLGREANAPLPAGIKAEGRFNGVISYTWPSREEVPAQGMIWFSGARLELPDHPPLKIEEASATVAGSRWHLNPARVEVGESQTALIEADWNSRTGALQLDVATQLLSVRGLQTGLGLLVQASTLPLLAHSRNGSWQGNLRYNRLEDADPGQWSGRFAVRNLDLDLAGVPGSLNVSTANIAFDPAAIAVRRLRAEWDGIELEGEADFSSTASGPVRLNLLCAEADLSLFDKLLDSARRAPSGLLDKMRLRRAPMPDWLRTRNVSGQIEFKALHFAGGSFGPLRMMLTWKGNIAEASFAPAEFSLPGQPLAARFDGKLRAELWQPSPVYRFEANAFSWPLDKGTASGQASFRFAQFGPAWLDSLEGEFTTAQPENARIVARQGRFTWEPVDSRRKPVSLSAPYWPLNWPDEP